MSGIGCGTQTLITELKTDSAHGLLGYTHGNGQRVTTGFDSALRLTQRQDGTANTQLAYNADDEIARLTRNTQTLDLGYDIRGRLQLAKGNNQSQAFTLDTNGNRLSTTDSTSQPQPYAYRPASDQLLSTPAQAYRYNAVGEPVQITGSSQAGQLATRTLAYGSMGELTAVSDNGKPIAHYRYNQNRQRIAKIANGQSTFFLWQGGPLAAEANAQGKIKTRYIYLGTRPVALIQYDDSNKPKLYAVHTDHLGTPLQVTDAQQQIVWQAEYDIYGRASVRDHSLHSGASPPTSAGFFSTAHASFNFNLRLPGQYEDAETGWYYNFHRYYNPDTGRYLTPDPIGLEGGTNIYAYVDGNPAGAWDPWGLAATIGDFDEVTEYIYQEMMNNYSSTQVSFIQTALSKTLTTPYGYSAWYNLVKNNAKWDHKYAISDKLKRSSQTVFNGTRATWFAHTPLSDGKSCPAPDSWYNYDVWSNIHYGFIGLRAGFDSDTLLDAAGFAQTGGSTALFMSLVTGKGLSGLRANDDPTDQAAIMLGFHLYKTYGKSFTLDQFRVEILKFGGLQKVTVQPK